MISPAQKNNMPRKLSRIGEFAVLLYSEDSVRGCHFRRKGHKFELKAHGIFPMDPQKGEQAFQQLKKKLNWGSDCIIILSGSIPGETLFFRTGMPELPLPATRQALTLELPRVMPGADPEDFLFEYVPAGKYENADEVQLNVYAFTRKGLDSLCSMISQTLRKVDYFVYPFLPLRVTDGALYLPEVEKEFFFASDQWVDAEKWSDSYYEGLEKDLSDVFELPNEPDFKIREYLSCLLISRFAASGDFVKRSAAIQILPSKLRPGRLRNQLRITALLLILLCGGMLWEYGGAFLRESRSFSAMKREKQSLDGRVRNIKRQLKASEKERKELQRLLQQRAGTQQVLEKLAALSSIFPQNVMVQSLRWTDSSVDLTLRSEAQDLNLPALIRQIPHWKISQMQERRRNNDAASTITLKLTPVTQEDPQ